MRHTHVQIISRADAIAAGMNKYFTGVKCKNGHIDWRFVSNFTCAECSRKKAVEYYRADPAAGIARRMNAYQKNQAAEREKMRRYYRDNLEAQKASKKKRYWSNPDLMRRQSREWAEANLDRRRSHHAARRERKLNATPGWFGELDEFVMQEAADLCRQREQMFGFPWHLDHMIPLRAKKACGLHCAANIQVIPAAINISKRNQMVLTEVFDWML